MQAFVNTHYDLEFEHGAELLATPAGLSRWLAARELIEAADPPLATGDLGRAIAVREGLRSLARATPTTSGGWKRP